MRPTPPLRNSSVLLALAAASLLACGAQPPADAARDPQACARCHLSEFASASHHVGERPTTCGVCHAQTSWHPSRLEHPFWELAGAHEKAKCFFCHEGTPPAFKGTPKACVACHRPEYEKAPEHVARFPTTCEECHTTAAWKPALPKPGAPSPLPAATGSAPSEPPVPPPRATPTSAPRPRPAPVPKPKPAPTPTVVPSTTPPDTLTGPSKRKR